MRAELMKHVSLKPLGLSLVLLSLGLASCGTAIQDNSQTEIQTKLVSEPQADNAINIRLNQLGFLPQGQKVATITGGFRGGFSLFTVPEHVLVFSGQSGPIAQWPESGEKASLIDFSEITRPGKYVLELADNSSSVTFTIDNKVYADIHDASLKAFYFNRATSALSPEYAGKWHRAAGHPDDKVMVHSSAASTLRPTGSLISAPKGWYDAGDYGKYVVNSGISTYSLLLAYRHFTAFYAKRDGQIPESTDEVPDILNEIDWNLSWLAAMQDPNDGGVYHKLTTLNFTGSVMPEATTEQRYVLQKSTAAALNFAAVMAFASQVYAEFESAYPHKSAEYQQAAIAAWNWAQANPQAIYKQPDDVKTGGYGDAKLDDEFAFAAAQLFVLTEDRQYLERFKQIAPSMNVPNWASTAGLGYFTLYSFAQTLLSPAEYQSIEQAVLTQAETIVKQQQQSAYGVAMEKGDFVWGSNAVAMNKAMMLLMAYQQSGESRFRNVAIGLTDYVLGRNPTGFAYVTGFGHKSPMHIHHRPSQADGIADPIPGFVAGGAQNGWQDKCAYPSKMPAASYADDFCSYSTNEIAINWNAPLVYVLAGLNAL